ncbi:hypothetical protein HYU15_00490, partial [Candidatus Woesearchaeota archaeon]|nr:hypothetical protein [Candidatus Woesearchaeota archaeon]
QLVMPQLYPLLNKEENEQFYATTKGQELIETYLGEVMHISKIHDFRTIILILDAVPKQKIIERNVAEKHNWAFIDVSELFDQTKFETTKTRIRPPYDSHFTPYAHQLVAEKLYNEVNWTGLCSKAFNESVVSG